MYYQRANDLNCCFFFLKSACSKKFPWTNLPFSTTVVEWTLPLSKGAMGHHQNTECKKSHQCWKFHSENWNGLVLLLCASWSVAKSSQQNGRYIPLLYLEEQFEKKSIRFVLQTKMPSALNLKNETRAELIRFRSLPGPGTLQTLSFWVYSMAIFELFKRLLLFLHSLFSPEEWHSLTTELNLLFTWNVLEVWYPT